jgi:hypothetical protein
MELEHVLVMSAPAALLPSESNAVSLIVPDVPEDGTATDAGLTWQTAILTTTLTVAHRLPEQNLSAPPPSVPTFA